jgi:Fic family protein
MPSDDQIRHSKALEAEIVRNPDEIAKIEAANGVRQFDAVTEMIEHFSHPERKFKLRPSHLLHLQRVALQGLSAYAGNYRPSDIKIGGSRHKPPGAHMVPEEIEHMCDYVNDKWYSSSPVHLAAYALWKLNWIHPFTDGNGRTARAISYLLLCLRLGGWPVQDTAQSRLDLSNSNERRSSAI